MTRRPGLSLVEVLSAIFIMGVGLISLFTLFPYGGLQYAAAFKDDRTAQSANAAEAYMRTYWKERLLEVNPPSPTQEPFFPAGTTSTDTMDDPNNYPPNNSSAPFGRLPQLTQRPVYPYPPNTPEPTPLLTPGVEDPSYPLFVDPMGWAARGVNAGGGKWWVAEQSSGVVSGTGLIARRNLADVMQFLGNPPTMNKLALRTCSLMDGLTYSPDGRSADATGAAADVNLATVQRELRYNWLWVLQRPNNTDRSLSRMSVVVFDKRADQYAPATSEVFSAYPIAASVASSTISFAAGGEPAGLKKGMWLLDATTTYDFYMIPDPSGMGGPPIRKYFSKIRNANFYRVVSATPSASGAQVDVELHIPLKPESKTRVFPGGPLAGTLVPDALPGERQFVLLAGVAEVYEKAPLTNTPSKP